MFVSRKRDKAKKKSGSGGGKVAQGQTPASANRVTTRSEQIKQDKVKEGNRLRQQKRRSLLSDFQRAAENEKARLRYHKKKAKILSQNKGIENLKSCTRGGVLKPKG